MKSLLPFIAPLLVVTMSGSATAADSADVERWSAAIQSARWTGPMLASNAETLPQGHIYTEPYFYDAIAGGDHHPGSSGFYQYGLLDELTVGLQPSFATGTNRLGDGMAVGDFKLLSQLRLTHFTPDHRVPTIAIALNELLPTGKHDDLAPDEEGHGSGSFGTEVGINAQQYFLLNNGRLLRARLNVLKSFYYGAGVTGRSVYGTGADFRGHVRPGSKTTLIGAVEYSLTNEWVLALDVEFDRWDRTTIRGRNGDAPLERRTIPASWNVGFAPAVEYNWSSTTGALLGVWIVPKGHNTSASVTPAIAISRFW
jgi:hypothetical protein